MAKHASKPKRSKAYRPKPKHLDSAFTVIRSHWRKHFNGAVDTAEKAQLRARFAEGVGTEQQEKLSEEFRTAFVAMLAGGGTMDDFSEVTGALNTALVLCERGFGEEYLNAMIEAQDQIFAAKLHYDSTGEWVFTDAARDAINEGLDVHAAQLEHAMQADVLSAYAEVARRLENNNVYREAKAA